MNTRPYLLSMAFGPVQAFIATARRTRDLWFGSWLLSEISKAGARALLDHASATGRPDAATLIFPHADAAALGPGSPLSVANKIVARIECDNPQAFANAARHGAIARWHELAQQCGDTFGWRNIDTDCWKSQIRPQGSDDDLIECYAAWVPLTGDYPAANANVNALLNARKATRHFAAAAIDPRSAPGFGRTKSSLDGARESVLKNPDDLCRRRFGIDRGEALDAPGLVKRVLGNRESSFTALSRVACEPWVRWMKTDARLAAKLDEIGRHYESLVKSQLATRAYRYADFRYDAQLIYEERAQQLLRSPGPGVELPAEDKENINKINKIMRSLGAPKPDAYVAVLMADGDHMGSLISRARSMDQHRALSAQLASFAAAVPDIVGEEWGECVYAGGDDVLAFLPAAKALACARRLAEAFSSQMRALDWVRTLPAAEQPTLSVGLAYGHMLTPLAELRRIARRAEQIAKHGLFHGDVPRNALGLVVHPRSGTPLELRGRWDDDAGGLFADRPGFDARLDYWIRNFADGTVSARAGYQLRRLEAEFRTLPAALVAETSRLVSRKGERSKQLITCAQKFMQGSGADRLHSEWIAARWLASHRAAVHS